jgi:hypothetical protein
MSTAAVSTSSVFQELKSFYHQRSADLQQLGQALQSGDLAGAQQEFNTIQSLGQSGPFASGNAFKAYRREQDFTAIGQALQSGDLGAAQQAFAQLQSTFHPRQTSESTPAVVVNLSSSAPASSPSSSAPSPASSPAPSASASSTNSQPAASSTGSANGTEIVLNLGNVTAGEQITIGVSNPGNGNEQVTIGVANQKNQSPEQITLNLNQNSNQQIILNLFNSTANTAQGSAVSVTA